MRTNFTASCYQRLVLPAIARAGGWESSLPPVETSRKRSSPSTKIDVISPTALESLFGLIPVKKLIGSPGSCARSAGRIWKAQRSVAPTAAAITLAFSKIPTGTSWKFAVGKVRSLRNDLVSPKGSRMTNPAHEPAILQGARRVRYLKLISLFKTAKGLLPLVS